MIFQGALCFRVVFGSTGQFGCRRHSLSLVFVVLFSLVMSASDLLGFSGHC